MSPFKRENLHVPTPSPLWTRHCPAKFF